MSECKFCKALKTHKFSARWCNKHIEGDYVYHEYTVALVNRSWTKAKGKRRASRSTDYRYQGMGFKLNYCPECGRELKRRRGEQE